MTEPDFRPRRFSAWDGTQDPWGPTSDELFDRLAEDVFHGWDFNSALRRLLSQGWRADDGKRIRGLEEMMERLRKQRQQQLRRYNLDGVFDGIRERLDGILRQERQGIAERVDNADETARRLLERVAQQRRQTLDQLSPDPGSAIRELRDYEWMDTHAEQQFDNLLGEMQQALTESFFQDVSQGMQSMTPQDVQRMREMVHDLNGLMRLRAQDASPEQLQRAYDRFREKWAQFFPDAPASFDEFVEQLQKRMAQMDSLMQSLSPEMREQLEALMQGAFNDEQLQSELAELMGALGAMSPGGRLGQRRSFFGEESLPLEQAMRMLGNLQSMEELEQALRDVYNGGQLDERTLQQLREALGDDAARSLEQLQQTVRDLTEQGVLHRDADGLQLTGRGMRRIGQKALGDLFTRLQRDRFGNHQLERTGHGGERTEETKPYGFGDPFDLDTTRTVMNAVRREAGLPTHDDAAEAAIPHVARGRGRGGPPRLDPDDFEVHRRESLTRCSTVLMLDMSRSMPLRGYFYAAKKVALALDSLIRSQYPRDSLHVIGFSDRAREIRSSSLAQLSVNEYVYGTNLQHGLMMARRLLSRDRGANKQILVITDGEPTAHMEGDHAVFFYPPLPETFQKTLVEVQRCTRENIVINTFMLESNHHLVDFVNQMTRLNRGRAFFISPDRLGDYILVDYARNRDSAA